MINTSVEGTAADSTENVTVETGTIQPSSFVIDAETFQKLQPKEYLRRFLRNNTRPDGRPFTRSRSINIAVDVITSAIGSSQVKIGNTIVTCGLKAEVARPEIKTPKCGFLIPNVDLPPLCHSKFKPGPPHEQTQVLSEYLNRLVIKSPLIDLHELCINENNAVWVLYADIVCLNYDGNAWDAILVSLVAALKSMKLPLATYDEDNGVVTASTTHFFNLGLVRTPVAVSFGLFDGQILMDPTDAEECVMDDKIILTLDEDNEMCTVFKLGHTPTSKLVFSECLTLAKTQSQHIRQKLDAISAK